MRTTLTHDQFAELKKNIEAHGSYNVRAYYSGRGMFGSTCYGVDVDSDYGSLMPVLLETAKAVAVINNSGDPDIDIYALEDAFLELGEPSSDGMGRGTIFYWRSIQVEPGFESDDEGEEY